MLHGNCISGRHIPDYLSFLPILGHHDGQNLLERKKDIGLHPHLLDHVRGICLTRNLSIGDHAGFYVYLLSSWPASFNGLYNLNVAPDAQYLNRVRISMTAIDWALGTPPFTRI
jgi:hypothetical protein